MKKVLLFYIIFVSSKLSFAGTLIQKVEETDHSIDLSQSLSQNPSTSININPAALFNTCELMIDKNPELKEYYSNLLEEYLHYPNDFFLKTDQKALTQNPDSSFFRSLIATGMVSKNLPQINPQDLNNLKKEIMKAVVFQKKFKTLQEKFPKESKAYKIIEAFDFNFSFALYFCPTLGKIFSNSANKLFLSQAYKELHQEYGKEDKDLVYAFAAFSTPAGLGTFPLHSDDDMFNMTPKLRNTLAYQLGVTDFSKHNSTLFVLPRDNILNNPRNIMSISNIPLWQSFLEKDFKNKRNIKGEDLLKIVACIEKGLTEISSLSFHLPGILVNQCSCLRMLEGSNSGVYFAEGKAGDGFFILPYRHCHGSPLPNKTKNPRITVSVRTLESKDFMEMKKLVYGVSEIQNITSLYKDVLGVIFNVSTHDLSGGNCLSNDSRTDNVICEKIEILNNFYQNNKVKSFLSQKDYANSLPEILERLTSL